MHFMFLCLYDVEINGWKVFQSFTFVYLSSLFFVFIYNLNLYLFEKSKSFTTFSHFHARKKPHSNWIEQNEIKDNFKKQDSYPQQHLQQQAENIYFCVKEVIDHLKNYELVFE